MIKQQDILQTVTRENMMSALVKEFFQEQKRNAHVRVIKIS